MLLKIRKNNILFLCTGVIVLIFCLLNMMFSFENEMFASILLLLLSIEGIVWSKNNYMLTIIMCILAYCNYSVVFSEYIHIIKDTMFTKYAGTEVATVSIYILLLFEAFLCCMLSFVDNSKQVCISSTDMEDKTYKGGIVKLFVLISNVILILILIFGFTRPSTLGDRGSPSTLYEYAIIIFIICFYFGNKYKWCKYLTSGILTLYVLQNFLFGGRITGLQLLTVVYIMMLESHWSLKRIFPIVAIGFFGMSVIGSMRGAFLTGNISLKEIIFTLKERMFTLDTAFSAYHTSMTFVLAEKFTNMSERIYVFIGFLKSIIVGGYNSVGSNVARYTAQYFHHYDGGFLPFFFQFYIGWIGIPLIAGYLSFLLNKMTKLHIKSSGLGKCICVYIVATTFRWYIYSPIQITRGIFLLSVCYILVEEIFKIATGRTANSVL